MLDAHETTLTADARWAVAERMETSQLPRLMYPVIIGHFALA